MPHSPKQAIDCIITAAGLSSRMGCWKLMLPYKTGTILDASINSALSFCSRIILVGGYRFLDLEKRYLNKKNILLCHNEQYQQGMFSSIQKAIKEVKTEYFFIAHGDMPCINTAVYQTLWDNRTNGVVFPGTPINTGHPVLLSQEIIANLLSAPINSKMKQIILSGNVDYLNINCESIFLDIDNPEAYLKLIEND